MTNTEKKTGKKWFGYDIYVRAFINVQLGQNTVFVTNEILTNRIVNLYGQAVKNGVCVDLNRGASELEVYSQNDEILISSSSSYNDFKANVIVEYIKI